MYMYVNVPLVVMEEASWRVLLGVSREGLQAVQTLPSCHERLNLSGCVPTWEKIIL